MLSNCQAALGGHAQAFPVATVRPVRPAYEVTVHCRERYVERHSNRKKYQHLTTCNKGCSKCVSLVYDLRKEVSDRRWDINDEICELLSKSKEIRIHTNNHSFLQMVYERHGVKRFDYFVNYDADILFVVVHDEDRGKVIVTCFSASDSVVGDFVRRPKYKAKVKYDFLGQPIIS
jgi:hypothetical protein